MTVTVQEIVETLKRPHWPELSTRLAERVQAEGIAPPDGMIFISAQTLKDAVCTIGRFINECDKEAIEVFDALVSAVPKPEDSPNAWYNHNKPENKP